MSVSHQTQIKWSVLKHDLYNALRFWPRTRQKTQEILGAIENLLVLNTAQKQSAWLDLQSRLQSDLSIEQKRMALEQFEHQHFAQQAPELAPEKIATLCKRLQTHWQKGLLPARKHLPKQLQDSPESPMKTVLMQWLQLYPEANFLLSKGLLEAHQALTQILSDTNAQDPLWQVLHNGLNQHYPVVTHVLTQYEPRLKAFRGGQKGLRLNELEGLIQSAQSLIPIAGTSSLGVSPSNTPAAQTAPNLILILEDDPLWQAELIALTHKALQKFFSVYYAGAENRWRTELEATWRVQAVSDVSQAQSLLNQSILCITDLSVPLHAGGESLRANGLNFLQEHIAQTLHPVPVIVHSSSVGSLQEVPELRSLGLQDHDLMLKADLVELETSILKWLQIIRARKIQQSGSLRPEQYVNSLSYDQRYFYLNKVKLNLSPRSQTLLLMFYRAARQKTNTLTASRIFAEIHPERFAQEKQQDSEKTHLRAARLQKIYSQLNPALAGALQAFCLHVQMRWDAYQYDKEDPYQPHEKPLYRWNRFLEKNPQIEASLNHKYAEYLHQGIDAHLPEIHQLPSREQWVSLFSLPQQVSHTEQNNTVSKWLYTLRSEIQNSLQQLGRQVMPHEIIVALKNLDTFDTQQKYRLSNALLLQNKSLVSRPDTQEPWRILLVENDAAWAEALSQEVKSYFYSSGQPYELRLARYVDEVPLKIQDWAPDLVLLDLHLPETEAAFHEDPSSGSETAGYTAWSHIQKAGYLPRVLITSVLADQYFLRRMGLSQELESRDFILKGAAFRGTPWPESFGIQLKRILTEIEMDALLPEQDFAHALPDRLPLIVEVLYYGLNRKSPNPSAQNIELELKVTALSPTGDITKIIQHRKAKAAALAHLLRQFPQKVSLDQWGQAIYGKSWSVKSKNKLYQKKNDLSKDIDTMWPVGWLQNKQQPPSDLILTVEKGLYCLNLRECTDPHKLLKAAWN